MHAHIGQAEHISASQYCVVNMHHHRGTDEGITVLTWPFQHGEPAGAVSVLCTLPSAPSTLHSARQPETNALLFDSAVSLCHACAIEACIAKSRC